MNLAIISPRSLAYNFSAEIFWIRFKLDLKMLFVGRLLNQTGTIIYKHEPALRLKSELSVHISYSSKWHATNTSTKPWWQAKTFDSMYDICDNEQWWDLEVEGSVVGGIYRLWVVETRGWCGLVTLGERPWSCHPQPQHSSWGRERACHHEQYLDPLP